MKEERKRSRQVRLETIDQKLRRLKRLPLLCRCTLCGSKLYLRKTITRCDLALTPASFYAHRFQKNCTKCDHIEWDGECQLRNVLELKKEEAIIARLGRKYKTYHE